MRGGGGLFAGHLELRRLIAEGIGTYFLVFIGPGAAAVDAFTGGRVGHAGIALAFAFVVTAMVFALGHLSGAHINPAVTIAFWSIRRFSGREVLPYIAAQLLGATAAALSLKVIVGGAFPASATAPAIPTGLAFGVEFLLSFILMLVIMATATDPRVAEGFAAIAIGLTVGFCALMAGPLTGASMNPARSLGPAVAAGVWRAHWLYWAAPITGMLFAARSYEILRRTEPGGFTPPPGGSRAR